MAEARLSPEEQAQQEAERRYFAVTRRLPVGLLFALPLIVIYELGVLLMGQDINAAAVIAKLPGSWLHEHPIQLLGTDLLVILNGVLILGLLGTLWYVHKLGALKIETFGGMLLESAFYALILGPIALVPITGELHFGGFSPRLRGFIGNLVIASGAGFYEEALFRFIILGALFFLAKELGKLKPFTAGALALVVSGGLFSTAHFFSPGESVDFGAFLFRLIAGMVLGLIYLTRGFGIAAWTHALYDVYVLCFAT